MIGVLTAKWVGDSLLYGGIYDQLIHLRGYPFLHDGPPGSAFKSAGTIMTPFEDIVSISAITNIHALRNLLLFDD